MYLVILYLFQVMQILHIRAFFIVHNNDFVKHKFYSWADTIWKHESLWEGKASHIKTPL